MSLGWDVGPHLCHTQTFRATESGARGGDLFKDSNVSGRMVGLQFKALGASAARPGSAPPDLV